MFLEDKEEADKDKSKSADKEEQEDEDESDDSSEDDSDDEDDDSEDDAEEGGKEDLLKQYSKDPASVPKELRSVVKKLLGSYTRKMQDASLVVRQAAAFNELIVDPEFRRWVEERKRGILSKSKSRRDSNDSDDEDDDEDKPLSRKDFKAMMAAQKNEDNLSKQQVAWKKEADRFKKDNPDWEIYKEEMGEVLDRNPGLSYEEVYLLASREDREKISKKDTFKSKKGANIHRPNRTQGKEGEKKGKMKFMEAYELAKKKLGLK